LGSLRGDGWAQGPGGPAGEEISRDWRGGCVANTTYLRRAVLDELVTWYFALVWRQEGLLVGVWVTSPRPSQEPLVCSYLPAVVDASRMTEFPVAGTPAGTVAVRASGLRFHGGAVTVAGNAPSAGELAVLCRPGGRAPGAG